MKIRRLRGESFRGFTNFDLEVSQDFTVLVGPNASGKTTVLESIFYASTLRAFPPARPWDLIRFGQSFFHLRLTTTEVELEYYYTRKDKEHYLRQQLVDGVRQKAYEMKGVLPTVAFLPQDLELLSAAPGVHRDFLDTVLLQASPDYEDQLGELGKLLTQRNELLFRVKNGAGTEEELDVWDERLALLSAKIGGARRGFVDFINIDLGGLYKQLTGSELKLTLRYLSSGTDHQRVLALLHQARIKDLNLGQTSVGPHRENWRIEDEQERNVAHFLSRGEQRGVVICLKLLEQRYLSESLKKQPVFLLDEFPAELDPRRQHKAFAFLLEGSQKFFSAVSLQEIPSDLRRHAQIIELPFTNPK